MSGCRSTKYVPEGRCLLDEVTIESDNKEIKPNDVQPYIKQKENIKVVGMVKFRLWLYNRAPKKGDGWLSKFLKKTGEAPVIYDENYTVQSEREIEHFLDNKGFKNGDVTTEVSTNEKKRKTSVIYKLQCNEPYRIADAHVDVKDTTICQLILEDSTKCLVEEGDLFDLDVLDDERDRITAKLKDQGYYDFNKESFSYEVDTTLGDFWVDGTLVLDGDSVNPQHSFDQYHIKKICFVVGYDAQEALSNPNYLQEMDTVIYKGIYFLYKESSFIKPEILYRNNLLKPGALYSKTNSNTTHSLLSAISIIQYVNINYEKVDTSSLNCNVNISLGEQQGVSLEFEGTNVSGNFGAAINAGYSHKNLFHGAEKLNASFTFGLEAIIGTNDVDVYRSKEFGVDLDLVYPKFILPFLDEDFNQKLRSQTKFGISYDFQERPEYTRNIATADMVYSWRTSDKIKHQFTPLMLNYIGIPEMTQKFHDHIDTTQYLKYSYEDHVIFGSRYTFTFQDDNEEEREFGHYLRLSLEGSGNMLNTFNTIIGKKETLPEEGSDEDSYYEFMNLRYSQYVKFDATGVINHHINKTNSVAYRAQLGIGVPYKNSSQLPFEKRYAAGGANGVRAWMVRSLGPGSYHNEEVDYYNQSGDINMIFSAEYRFKLIGIFEGALFADAGNTWAIRDYEEQPGAVFEFDNFYNQIAAGVGAGLRLDIKFFIFRLDCAWKAVDPIEEAGNRWVLGQELIPTTHIAIGYPF